MQTVDIGFWIEAEEREETRCPSGYAADWETLRTTPGRYPAQLVLAGGYAFPMPQWVLVRVPATRIAGRTYSGFGGYNFASSEIPPGPAHLPLQLYAYHIPGLVAAGKLELLPEYAGLATDYLAWARDRHAARAES